MNFPDRLKLPLAFEPAGLQADLDGLAGTGWTAHFVKQNYDGDWSVLPLRAQAGATHPILQIYSDPGISDYVDTPLLARCPHLRAALAAFRCPLTAVRLMRLAPGSHIKEHSDHDLDAALGVARIHVPITTNPHVLFEVNRRAVDMAPGTAWYLRLSDPHRVANHGATDRVHLVIDAKVDDWLADMLRRAAGAQAAVGAG